MWGCSRRARTQSRRGARLSLAVGDGLLNELSLTTVAVGRDHKTAGDSVGHCGTEVLANHVEAEIESGGAASGGQDIAFIDVEHVGIDADLRISAGEFVRVIANGLSPGVRRGVRRRRGRRRRNIQKECGHRAGVLS